MRRPTIEWQVAGACNYSCSYCIQSPRARRGGIDEDRVDVALDFFASLPGRWEIKCSGGEAFAHRAFLDRIVPGLMARTPHQISVLTNFSASARALMGFAAATRGRLAVFSASLHLEHVDVEAFVTKARWFADQLDPEVDFVINQVIRPGHHHEARRGKELADSHGLRWFGQRLKVGGRVAPDPDLASLTQLIGRDPTSRDANVAPSYQGRPCWAGTDYLVIDKQGDAWSCRTAKRVGDGHLGNLHRGDVQRLGGPAPCPYDVCPCAVPANRGMVT